MPCPMLAGLHLSARPFSGQLVCYYNNPYGCFNVAVQVHGYVVFADLTNGAVRQIGDVVSTDRAEQFALIARGSGDGDFQFSQLGSAGFGVSLLLGSQLFQLSAAGFESRNVSRGSGSGFALRQQ